MPRVNASMPRFKKGREDEKSYNAGLSVSEFDLDKQGSRRLKVALLWKLVIKNTKPLLTPPFMTIGVTRTRFEDTVKGRIDPGAFEPRDAGRVIFSYQAMVFNLAL